MIRGKAVEPRFMLYPKNDRIGHNDCELWCKTTIDGLVETSCGVSYKYQGLLMTIIR